MTFQQTNGNRWGNWIDDYLDFLRAAGRSAATIRLRADQLGYLARCVPAGPHLTTAMLVTWLAAQAWAPETMHSYSAGVRGFYRWAHRQGRVLTDPGAELPAVFVGRAVPRPAPEDVWRDAVTAAGPRVALMLRLAACAGLRRSEIARLHSDDVRSGPVLVVHGKGARDRIVPISESLAAELGAADGWVFPSARTGSHLSPEWVGALCAAALPDDYTLHTLRHRFGTVTYAGSHDLRAVQELLGHSSPAITQRYVAVCDEDLRRAAMLAAQ